MALTQADLDRLDTNIDAGNDWVEGDEDADGTDANGNSFKSIRKINNEAELSLASQAMLVPIPYAGGIVYTASETTKTVEEVDVIYAPKPSALPFTTSGTFIGDDDARYYVVQNGSATAITATPATPLSSVNVQGQLDELAGLVFGENYLLNAKGQINQRVVSGSVVLLAGEYGHDRFRAGSGGCTYTFSESAGITTFTISAGTLEQSVEAGSAPSGPIILSWGGSAQGRIDGGSFGSSGVTGTATGTTAVVIEWNTGTLSLPHLEPGSIATSIRHRDFGAEFSLCQATYEKSYNLAAAPGAIADAGNYAFSARTGGTQHFSLTFSVSKRGIPDMVFYSPTTGASGMARDDTAAADATLGQLYTGESGVPAGVISPVGVAGDLVRFHWTAEVLP